MRGYARIAKEAGVAVDAVREIWDAVELVGLVRPARGRSGADIQWRWVVRKFRGVEQPMPPADAVIAAPATGAYRQSESRTAFKQGSTKAETVLDFAKALKRAGKITREGLVDVDEG